MAKKKMTKAQLARLVAAVKKAFPYDDHSELHSDLAWDWFGGSPAPSIYWEGGPYDWVWKIDEKASFRELVASMGFYAEAVNSWSVSFFEA